MDNPSGMKVLILDIETSPIDAYTWGIWQQNVGLSQIKAPTRMLSWAAKWEADDEVTFASERTHTHRNMVLDIYDLVNEADAIVHYNGTAFDMKHLNREFIEQGLAPPLKYKNIDLLRVVKSQFKFPSNKLDYVAGVLLGEHKLDTGGFGLWVRVLEGDTEAWMQMEEYNCEDVRLTERLYHRVQGWIPAHPNRALWIEDQDDPHCPNCGSGSVVLKGVERPARVNSYHRYKCNDCGANARGRSIVRKAGPGVLM
jgi:DNA polymerase elongation subunit (family B)